MYNMVVLIIFFFISTKSDPHNIGSLTTKRLISGHTDLEESSLEWTSVNTKKEYRCKDSVVGADGNWLHTKFFEYDRTQSSFEFYCLTNGSYDFHNDTHHWPVCYEGI